VFYVVIDALVAVEYSARSDCSVSLGDYVRNPFLEFIPPLFMGLANEY